MFTTPGCRLTRWRSVGQNLYQSHRSRSGPTNWKAALDAWFWDEINLFPVSSVYRCTQLHTGGGEEMLWCWQVPPQPRDWALQPAGLGPHQQGGLRPHRVQAGGLGGQVSDMSRGRDNVTPCCGRYYVCNYGEGGNVISRPVYRVGRPCSQCPDSTSCSYKYPGLCSRSSHV